MTRFGGYSDVVAVPAARGVVAIPDSGDLEVAAGRPTTDLSG